MRTAWATLVIAAALPRFWNALFGPLFYAYDEWAHVSYLFFLDTYHSLPYADQGWSYFHPPLYYAIGWGMAQLGSAEALLRGLALFGALLSLGTAGLAGWLVQRCFPEPRWLGLVAFVALAFLPVHVFTSGMIGNEMLACFLASAALVCAVCNEEKTAPTLRCDVATGALVGLAALTKFSGLTVLAAIGAALGLHFLLRREQGAWRQLMKRGFAIAAVAGVIAGPFYLRNLAEYGNPFQFSNEFAPMVEVERGQPPGERGLRDFVSLSPKIFVDPSLDAPHLIHSVWGSLYLNLWFDTFGASQLPVESWNSHEPRKLALTRLFAILGIGPTLLALVGLFASLRTYRDARSFPDLLMPLLTGLCLLSFVIFAIRVPSWAAIKASYLMALSLPWAWFVARGVLALQTIHPRLAGLGIGSVAVAALACALVFTSGAVLEMRPDKRELAGLHTLFGDTDAAREGWQRAARISPNSRIVADGLGAAELISGRNREARRHYRRALRRPLEEHPYRANRLAVAAALDGDPEAAWKLLVAASAGQQPVELRINRAALLLQRRQAKAAERVLRSALDQSPGMPAALQNLAYAVELQNGDAAEIREQAELALFETPRGFPYAVGNGDLRHVGGNQRWLLVASSDGLSLYRPPRAR